MDAWHFFPSQSRKQTFLPPQVPAEDVLQIISVSSHLGGGGTHTAEILSLDYAQQRQPRSAVWRHDLFLLGNGKASLKMHADRDFRRQTGRCLLGEWQHLALWSLETWKNTEQCVIKCII